MLTTRCDGGASTMTIVDERVTNMLSGTTH